VRSARPWSRPKRFVEYDGVTTDQSTSWMERCHHPLRDNVCPRHIGRPDDAASQGPLARRHCAPSRLTR
jgi:hypothetical protein